MSAEPPRPFSCPMCSQHFRTVPGGVSGDPRPFLLPSCGHTVCGACTTAQAAALSKEKGDVIAVCPMCGEGGSEGPTLNGLIAAVAEAAYARTHAMPVVLECMYCVMEDDHVPATHVCVSCAGQDRPVCDDHAAIHRKKAHPSLVPVSEYKGPLLTASGPAAAAASGPAMCLSHPKYELDRFCFSCEAPVCAECCLSSGSHPESSHTVKDVATAAGTLRSQLESLKTEATTVVGTVTGQAAVVEEACASMTADYTASREAFQAWIEASVAALRKLESDVIGSAQSLLQSKTNTLRAQGKGLRVSGTQLSEVLSLIGQTDVSNPVALAGVYGLMKRVLSGVRAKPITGPVVSPVVKVGFDASLLTSALEYCAWVVKDDVAGAGVDAVAKADLSAAVEACGTACGAAGEALARVAASASRVRSGLVGVRESLVSKVDCMKAAIDVAAAAALGELNDVAEGRLALLGQQERGLSGAYGGLSVAAKVGRAALLSGDAGRVSSAVGVVKGAVGQYGSVFEVPSVPVTLDVLFDESVVLEAVRMTVKKYDVCFEGCEVSGSGLEGFVGGGAVADGARQQNMLKLVCKDEKGGVVGGVESRDVSLRVFSVGGAGGAGGDGVAGEVVSIVRDGPGVFTCVYAVGSEDVESVDVDVRVYGERVGPCPVRVLAVPKHEFTGSAVLSSVAPATLRLFSKGMKSWLPGAGKPVLLFRMTRDGKNTSDFHSRCDGKASTVVLIKSSNGFVFGAYAGVAWPSSGYASCSNSFTFTVVNPHNISPTRFLVNYPQHAIYGRLQDGPYFGNIALCIGARDGSLTSQGYVGFQHYTDTTGKGPAIFTGATDHRFTAAEVEVWQVPVRA